MSTTEQVQNRAQAVVQRVRERGPNSRQVLGLVTLLTAGVVLLVLGGLTLSGTAIALALLTPVLIFFSPILIPLGTVLFLATAALLTAGAFGLAVFSGMSWLYNYVKGRHPPGADQLDAARSRIAHTASSLKDRALDYTHSVQDYMQHTKDQAVNSVDAAPGA